MVFVAPKVRALEISLFHTQARRPKSPLLEQLAMPFSSFSFVLLIRSV